MNTGLQSHPVDDNNIFITKSSNHKLIISITKKYHIALTKVVFTYHRRVLNAIYTLTADSNPKSKLIQDLT